MSYSIEELIKFRTYSEGVDIDDRVLLPATSSAYRKVTSHAEALQRLREVMEASQKTAEAIKELDPVVEPATLTDRNITIEDL